MARRGTARARAPPAAPAETRRVDIHVLGRVS